MQGVTLPILQHITITNVPLYSQQVPLQLRVGLNVVLGVNGLGKTTTVKIALIGIVGNVAQDRAVQSIVSDATAVPSVSVQFQVGADNFQVERNLKSCRVTSFRHVDPDGVIVEHSNLGAGDPDSAFEERLIAVSGSGNLDNLHFLLSRLIFREEEAEHLLWDPANQHRVLRLLVMGGTYEARWKESFDKSVSDDTKFRQHREFLRRDAEARQRVAKDLEEAQASLQTTMATSLSSDGRTLLQVREEIDRLTTDRTSLERQVREVEAARDALREQRHQQALGRDELSVELDRFEATIHERAFAEFSVIGMAARRLRQRGLCLFCDQTVGDQLQEHLLRTKLNVDACPLCEQTLGVASSGEFDTERFRHLVSREEDLTHVVTDYDKRLSVLTRQITSLREQLSSLNDPLQGLQSEYISASDGTVSPVILQERVGQLEGTLSHFDQRRVAEEQLLAELDDVRRGSRERLDGVEGELAQATATQVEIVTGIFSELSQKLLGREVPLQLVETKGKGQQKDYAVFQPVLDSKPRHRALETATHERFLLDYAFRMAALSYYSERTGNPTFFAIEPADGAMDPVYADHLASTLHSFAYSHAGNTLLLIANLKSVEFIKGVYGQLGLAERLERTVDFRRFGHLKGLQVKEGEKYDDVWAAIFSA